MCLLVSALLEYQAGTEGGSDKMCVCVGGGLGKVIKRKASQDGESGQSPGKAGIKN